MRVLIVGGGSAGWITAATLLARLGPQKAGGPSITLIESPDTPRIGVGEATIPTFRTMLAEFGLAEADVFNACDATVKHGIRFDGWRGEGSRYLHPFHHFGDNLSQSAAKRWMQSNRERPFSELVSAQDALIRQGKAPRPLNGKDYAAFVPYAYHLDAEMFADLIAADCIAKGVTRACCHLDHIARDSETGHVVAVQSTEGERFVADLYVDCTGFRQLLLNPADKDSAWIDQSAHLICDRAVTLRIPRGQADVPDGFTRATAMEAGWSWDIGLGTRRGRGYVYSSAHATPEQAETALRAQEGAAAQGCAAGHLKFKVGRCKQAWRGNVVSIGLSAGFLEPLESTGLYFAQTAARFLAQLFPPSGAQVAASPLAACFNQRLGALHDSVLDFIALHYALAKRPEPFWRDAADVGRQTARLSDWLALWSLRPPEQIDTPPGFGPFTHQNYEFILMGNDWSAHGLTPSRAGLGPHPLTGQILAHAPDLNTFHNAMRGIS